MQRKVRYEDNGDWYSIGARKGTEKEVKTGEKGKGERNKCWEKNKQLKKLNIKIQGKIMDQECPSKFKILYVRGRFHPHRRNSSKQEQAFRVQVPEFFLQTPESYNVEWQNIVHLEEKDSSAAATENSPKIKNPDHQMEKEEKNQKEIHKTSPCSSAPTENLQRLSFQESEQQGPSSYHEASKAAPEEKMNNKEKENKGERNSTRQLSPIKNKEELTDSILKRKTKPIVDLVKKETQVKKEEDSFNDKEKKEPKTEKRSESRDVTKYSVHEMRKTENKEKNKDETISQPPTGDEKKRKFGSKYYLPSSFSCPAQETDSSGSEALGEKPIRMYEPSESDFVKREPHRELVRPTSSGLTIKPCPQRPCPNRMCCMSLEVARRHGIKYVPQKPSDARKPSLACGTERECWVALGEEADEIEASYDLAPGNYVKKTNETKDMHQGVVKKYLKSNTAKDDERGNNKEQKNKESAYSAGKETLIKQLVMEKELSTESATPDEDWEEKKVPFESTVRQDERSQGEGQALHLTRSSARVSEPQKGVASTGNKETLNEGKQLEDTSADRKKSEKAIPKETDLPTGVLAQRILNQPQEDSQLSLKNEASDETLKKNIQQTRNNQETEHSEEQLTTIIIKRSTTRFITFSNGFQVVEHTGTQKVAYGQKIPHKNLEKRDSKLEFLPASHESPNKQIEIKHSQINTSSIPKSSNLLTGSELGKEIGEEERQVNRASWKNNLLSPRLIGYWFCSVLLKSKDLVRELTSLY